MTVDPSSTRTEYPIPKAVETASPQSRQLWEKPLLERWRDLLNPTQETVDSYTLAGVEGFTQERLAQAIERFEDPIPLIKSACHLDNPIIAGVVRSMVRLWWPHIFSTLTNPRSVIERFYRNSPEKARLLDTTRGQAYLNMVCYRSLTFLQQFAAIPDQRGVAPPPDLKVRVARVLLRPKPQNGGNAGPKTS